MGGKRGNLGKKWGNYGEKGGIMGNRGKGGKSWGRNGGIGGKNVENLREILGKIEEVGEFGVKKRGFWEKWGNYGEKGGIMGNRGKGGKVEDGMVEFRGKVGKI